MMFIVFAIWSTILHILAEYLVNNNQVIKTIKKSWFRWNVPSIFFWLFLSWFNMVMTPPFPEPYFLLFSTLWIVFYTDFRYMLISRFTSLYLIPVGILCAHLHLLPITPLQSLSAACIGYGFFWLANQIFRLFKKCDGLGQGDMDLIALIGSFLGFAGIWLTITISSLLGTIVGLMYMLWHRRSIRMMPYGPFLVIGAVGFILFQNYFYL